MTGIVLAVIDRFRLGGPKASEYVRQRLSKFESIFRERLDVIARGHGDGRSNCPRHGGGQQVDILTDIVKPPGVGLVEPAAKGGIVQLITRHISVFKNDVDVFGRKPLAVIKYRGHAFYPCGLQRIVCRNPNIPAFQISANGRIVRKRYGRRTKLQSPKHV